MQVRTRIAPSPTGDPHVGTAYMALFNQIWARHFGGRFILRIEDTDQARGRPEYETAIFSSLKWLGLSWDEGPDVGGPFGPYRQSERLSIYREQAEKLLGEGKAYKCFCSEQELKEMREVQAKQGRRTGYDRRCRNLSEEEIAEKERQGIPFVLRLKVPLRGECTLHDQIRGRLTFPWADIDDQVLLKTDGFPTYHLANVVDDHLMEITHVIRGDEWISSTPKHLLLYEAFGFEPPTFLHMPLLLGTDGKKLSKRRNPTSIFFYRDSGYLPEAFVNFLTLMGYSMPGDQEIYSLGEVTAAFDPARIGSSGAIFDRKKLDWINQHYIIHTIPEGKLWDRIKEWMFSDSFIKQLMPLCHTRIKTFADFFALCDFFFINDFTYTPELFSAKGVESAQVPLILQTVIWQLDADEAWNGEGLNQASHRIAELFGVNHKKGVMPLLFASIMGKRTGPPLFASVDILGKERVRARLLSAMEALGGVSKKQLTLLKKSWDAGDCRPLLTP